MTLDPLFQLSTDDLHALASAFRSGRIGDAPEESTLERAGIRTDTGGLLAALRTLGGDGAGGGARLAVVEALIGERQRNAPSVETCELVWSGPDVSGVPSRDTGVVIRGLFAGATRSVLVAGYAVHQGREVFAELARRMDELSELDVALYLDVQRPSMDTTRAEDLTARFAQRFRSREWPGKRMPRVHYDPRSLEIDVSTRASLHAKCVVVDGQSCLVTSANLTRAALSKNVELGLLVRSPRLARQIESIFSALAADGRMRYLPL